MKKFRFISFLFIMIILLGILCSCFGQQGPVGLQGAQGVQGPQGEPGKDGVDGEDGHTPNITIGENGNWYIDGIDTKVSATGPKGETGNGISSIEKTSTNGVIDIYIITYTDGTTSIFTVTNGNDGVDGKTPYIGDNGNLLICTIIEDEFCTLHEEI